VSANNVDTTHEESLRLSEINIGLMRLETNILLERNNRYAAKRLHAQGVDVTFAYPDMINDNRSFLLRIKLWCQSSPVVIVPIVFVLALFFICVSCYLVAR
jgi:hypothetical protein